MPKFDKYNFDTIQSAFADYDTEARKIMQNFRTMEAVYREESKKYKNDREEYNSQMKRQREQAKSRLDQARKTFQEHINNSVGALKCTVSSDIMQLPDPELAKTLRTLNDLDIQLSKTELEGLIAKAGNNYIAIRSLAKLAEKSGYTLDFPTLEELNESLQPYEHAAQSTGYYPEGYLHEACQIYGKDPTPYTAEDGTTKFTLHDLTPAEMIAKATPVKACQDTTETVKRWSMVTPSLEAIVDTKTATETEPAQVEVNTGIKDLPPDLGKYRYNHTVI